MFNKGKATKASSRAECVPVLSLRVSVTKEWSLDKTHWQKVRLYPSVCTCG